MTQRIRWPRFLAGLVLTLGVVTVLDHLLITHWSWTDSLIHGAMVDTAAVLWAIATRRHDQEPKQERDSL